MLLPPAVVHKPKPELYPDLAINLKHRTRNPERDLVKLHRHIRVNSGISKTMSR